MPKPIAVTDCPATGVKPAEKSAEHGIEATLVAISDHLKQQTRLLEALTKSNP